MRAGIVILALSLTGCSVAYYAQAISGHLELLRERRPADRVIADARTPDRLRARLIEASFMLGFAHDQLALPDNDSYRYYAKTGRRYVVWNVVATPALSLEPRTWCFPVAGCVSYRGYFDARRAEAFAADLSARGDDVFVGGVVAYSTLGRFADPLLDTMLATSSDRLAGLLFHELAHQRTYVKDDSAFNEAFASFIEIEGLRRWFVARGDRAGLCRHQRERLRRRQVLALTDAVRGALTSVYTREIPVASKFAAKSALLATLPAAYRRLRAGWDGPPDFDDWFARPFDNARLAAWATYDAGVPAFAELLARNDDDLERFYAAVDALAQLAPERREAALQRLRAQASARPPAQAADACRPSS